MKRTLFQPVLALASRVRTHDARGRGKTKAHPARHPLLMLATLPTPQQMHREVPFTANLRGRFGSHT